MHSEMNPTQLSLRSRQVSQEVAFQPQASDTLSSGGMFYRGLDSSRQLWELVKSLYLTAVISPPLKDSQARHQTPGWQDECSLSQGHGQHGHLCAPGALTINYFINWGQGALGSSAPPRILICPLGGSTDKTQNIETLVYIIFLSF